MKFSLILSIAAVVLGLSFAGAEERVFEMRTYYANEGKLEALNARFRDHTVALFEKHGMTNIGYWVPNDNAENKLVYVLAYESRAARSEAWSSFKKDPDWVAAYKASTADGKLVARVDKSFMVATDYSPQVNSVKAAKERAFELRIYTTSGDNLKNLDTRFRTATMEIFENHGMENIAYWHLMDDQEGHENQLVYIIAHDSVEARAVSWKAFGADPKWKAAKEKSVELAGGGLLVKKGVKSVMLRPTDYSPMR